MNILEQIAERTKERIQKKKMIFSLAEQRKAAEENSRLAPSFAEALRQSELSFICEVKKASPSNGVIAEEFPYLDIAAEYEQAGAAAISLRYRSLPWNQYGSVRQEIAAAPACSYSAAMSR